MTTKTAYPRSRMVATWTGLLAIAILLSLACSSVSLLNADAKTGTPQPTLDTVVLEIKGIQLLTELANTPAQRQKGLSYRKSLAANSGMLFVYKQERQLIFTMRETSIPLSIAFIDSEFVIREIHQMTPFAKEHYPSRVAARYALEVNSGWFADNGIKAGAKVILKPDQ